MTRIKEVIDALKLSEEKLCTDLNINQIELKKIEDGSLEMKPSTLNLFLKSSGVSLDYLLGNDPINKIDRKIENVLIKKQENKEYKQFEKEIIDYLKQNGINKEHISFINNEKKEINAFRLLKEDDPDLLVKISEKYSMVPGSYYNFNGIIKDKEKGPRIHNDNWDDLFSDLSSFLEEGSITNVGFVYLCKNKFDEVLYTFSIGKLKFDPNAVLFLINKGAFIKFDFQNKHMIAPRINNNVFETLLLKDYCERLINYKR